MTPLLLGLIAASCGGAPLDSSEVSQSELSNGARVVWAQRPDSAIVHFELALRRGSRWDPDGRAGLARVSAEALVAAANAHCSAATEYETVRVRCLTSTASIATTISRLLEHTAPKALTDAQIERARARVAQRRKREAERSPAVLSAAIRLAIGRPTLGRRESIESIELADVRAWLNDARIAPVLGVSGALSDATKQSITDLVLGLPKGRPNTVPAAETPPALRARGDPSIIVIDQPGRPGAWVAAISHTGTITDALSARAAEASLAGGWSAELTTRMRRAWPDSAALLPWQPDRERPSLVVVAGAPAGELSEVIEMMLDAFDEYGRTGLAAAPAMLGRRLAASRAAYAMSSERDRLSARVAASLEGRSLDTAGDRAGRLGCLSLPQISKALEQMVNPRRVRFVVVIDADAALLARLARIQGIRAVEVLSVDQVL